MFELELLVGVKFVICKCDKLFIPMVERSSFVDAVFVSLELFEFACCDLNDGCNDDDEACCNGYIKYFFGWVNIANRISVSDHSVYEGSKSGLDNNNKYFFFSVVSFETRQVFRRKVFRCGKSFEVSLK